MSIRKLLLAVIIFTVIILGYAIEDAVSDVTSLGSTTKRQRNNEG